MTRLFSKLVVLILALSVHTAFSADCSSGFANEASQGALLPDQFIPDSGKYMGQVLTRYGEGVFAANYFVCGNCKDDRNVPLRWSAREVSRTGKSGCPTCGDAPIREEEPEMVKIDGRLYIVNPDDVVRAGDFDESIAKSGSGWICTFCQSPRLSTETSCKECGSSKTDSDNKLVATNLPGRSNGKAKVNPAQVQQRSGDGQSKSASGPSSVLPGTQIPKKGVAYVSAVAGVGLMWAVWWGSSAEALPGQVTAVQGETAIVTYVDKKGRQIEIDLTPGAGTKNFSGWKIGDRATVYVNNFRGPRGAEGVDGETGAVQGKREVEQKQW